MINIELRPGPSSKGRSFYQSILPCPKRTTLWAQRREAGLPKQTGKATAIGTLVHAYLEAYNTGVIRWPADVDRVQFGPFTAPELSFEDPDIQAFVLDEAKRLAKWWVQTYEPQHFGRPLGYEVDVTACVATRRDLFQIPATNPDVPELTARLDEVVTMDEVAVARMREAHHLDLTPGVYVIDHKTKSRNYGLYPYLQGLQALLYPLLLHEAIYPERECEGILYNFILKTKEPKNIVLWRPPPSSQERAVIRNTLSGLWQFYQSNPNWANAAACFDELRDEECYFHKTGECDRV